MGNELFVCVSDVCKKVMHIESHPKAGMEIRILTLSDICCMVNCDTRWSLLGIEFNAYFLRSEVICIRISIGINVGLWSNIFWNMRNEFECQKSRRLRVIYIFLERFNVCILWHLLFGMINDVKCHCCKAGSFR